MSTKKIQILNNLDFVSYNEQTLTDEQKVQVRENIGAGVPFPEGATANQQLVTDGDGNAKWEDRLAYDEILELKEILPEETFTTENGYYHDPNYRYTYMFSGTYEVTFDGKIYVCDVKEMPNLGRYYLGNGSFLPSDFVEEQLEDTGEPFLFVSTGVGGDGDDVFMDASADGNHTIGIKEIVTQPVPMDGKFLPEGLGGFKGIAIAVGTTSDEMALSDDAKDTLDRILTYYSSGIKVAAYLYNDSWTEWGAVYAPLVNVKVNSDRKRQFVFAIADSDMVFRTYVISQSDTERWTFAEVDTSVALHSVATSGSWNDLEDKPFYQPAPLEEDAITSGAYNNGDQIQVVVDVGREYKVVFNGQEFILPMREDEYSKRYIGDGGLTDQLENPVSDSTIPFCLWGDYTDDPWMWLVLADGISSANIEMYLLTEADPVPIAEEFIPKSISRTADLHVVATSGSWNDLSERPFGEEVAETLVCEVANTGEYISEFDLDYDLWNAIYGKNVRVYCTGSSFGSCIIDTQNVEGVLYCVDESCNLNFRIEIAMAGLMAVSYSNGSSVIDIDLKVCGLTKIVTPLDETYIPTAVPVIQSAQVGQTVVVKAVDDSGKPTEWEAVDITIEETDPTVPAWAKAETKPTYTAEEVGAAEAIHHQAASTIAAGTFAGEVIANASAQTPATALLRNSTLVTADTDPTHNGEICWTYE